MTQINKLRNIKQRVEKNGFVDRREVKLFNDSVVLDYVLSPEEIGKVEIEGMNIQGLKLRGSLYGDINNTDVYVLCSEKNGLIAASYGIKSETIQLIPDIEMQDVFTSMGSCYMLLPNNLNDYQIRRISHEEVLFSYTAKYIIRESWGKKLCSLPQVDNNCKPLLNTYAEQWLKIYDLCVKLYDILPSEERLKFPRAWDLLKQIVHEHRQLYFTFLFSDATKESVTKGEIVSRLRKEASNLSKGINPYDRQFHPSKHLLTEKSLMLVKNGADAFISDYWKPYLTSLNNWAKILDESSNVLAVWCSDMGTIIKERQGSKLGN